MIILKTSIPLLKESSMILMQTVPTHLKIQEMQDRLIDQIPGVVSVHEFHVWQLAGSKIIGNCVLCFILKNILTLRIYVLKNPLTCSSKKTPLYQNKPHTLFRVEKKRGWHKDNFPSDRVLIRNVY